MELRREGLVRHLVEEYGLDEDEVEGNALLFSSGRLDSFVLVELVTYLEKHSGAKISPMDFTLDNLDSVDRIMSYITRRAV